MRKINRLLSVLLVFALILSSGSALAVTEIPAKDIIDDIFKFDVGNFAGEGEVIVGEDPDVKKIEFLDSIGVWDDATKSKDALLTMTEFSIIMSKVKLGSENALLKVYEKDPDDNKVTYKDVFEYILHATGYYYRCAEFGNTPESILIVASDIGLVSQKPENINEFITRGELARLISKAITLDMCVIEYTDFGYNYVVSEGKTILNSVHGIYDVSGFVNAIPDLSVYGGALVRDGYIQIERTNINTADMNVDEYFGTFVTAYAFYDDVINEYNLVYIAPQEDNAILEIDFNDIIDIKGNDIFYIDAEGTEYEVSVDGFKFIVENGKSLESIAEMSNFKTNEGKIRLVASEKSGGYDTAVIFKYDYYMTDYIDTINHRIGIKNGMLHNGNRYIQINDKKNNRIYVDYALADYTKIPVGRAVRVLQCVDTGYTEIVASKETASGEITMVYDNIVGVGGKSYRISKNMLNRIDECVGDETLSYNDKLRMPELGNKVTVYVVGGIVAGYTTGQEYQYAYLKSASLSRTSIDPEATIRIFAQSGEWLDLTFTDKVTLDGIPGKSKQVVSDFIVANANTVIGELIRYKTTNEGLCNYLDTVISENNEAERTDDIARVKENNDGPIGVMASFDKWGLYSDSGTIPYYFKATTPIFVIPEDKDREDKYKLITPSSLTYGVTNNMIMYSPDEWNHLSVVAIHGEVEIENTSDDTETWLHVDNLRRVIIDKDKNEFGYRVMGMQFVNLRSKGNGVCQKASYLITDEQYEDAVKGGTDFVVGDIIKISISKDKITKWEFLPGIERGTSRIAYEPGLHDIYKTVSNNKYIIMVGTVVKVDAENALMRINVGTPENPSYQVFSPRAKGIINATAKTTANASISDYYFGDKVYAIAAYGSGAGNAQMIFKVVN